MTAWQFTSHPVNHCWILLSIHNLLHATVSNSVSFIQNHTMKKQLSFLDHAHLDNLWHVNFLLCQIRRRSVERSDKDKCVFARLWVQDLTEELVNDGHEGNAWVFTLPLCLSCPFPRLFSLFPSHFLPPLCGFFSWLSSALNSALLCPQMGTVQILSNKGLLSTIMCWNTVAALKLRRRDTLLSLWIPQKMQDFH